MTNTPELQPPKPEEFWGRSSTLGRVTAWIENLVTDVPRRLPDELRSHSAAGDARGVATTRNRLHVAAARLGVHVGVKYREDGIWVMLLKREDND